MISSLGSVHSVIENSSDLLPYDNVSGHRKSGLIATLIFSLAMLTSSRTDLVQTMLSYMVKDSGSVAYKIR